MKIEKDESPVSSAGELREVRFSLRRLLEEVVVERRLGSLGSEKIHQADVRRMFRSKKKKTHGS